MIGIGLIIFKSKYCILILLGKSDISSYELKILVKSNSFFSGNISKFSYSHKVYLYNLEYSIKIEFIDSKKS